MKIIAKQRGATLFMTLIMLVVLTLFVVSAITTSTVNLRVVGNMQVQHQAEAAAQQAIEQLASDKANFTTPAAHTYTINGYTVTVAKPLCRKWAAFDGNGLQVTPANQTWWEITARVNDANNTDAVAIVHQGVKMALDPSVFDPTVNC